MLIQQLGLEEQFTVQDHRDLGECGRGKKRGKKRERERGKIPSRKGRDEGKRRETEKRRGGRKKIGGVKAYFLIVSLYLVSVPRQGQVQSLYWQGHSHMPHGLFLLPNHDTSRRRRKGEENDPDRLYICVYTIYIHVCI